MAIMMIMSWPGVSLEEYETLKAKVNWEDDRPTGGNFHATAHDGNGLRITDIWETAEDFQAFVGDRLMPAVQEVGNLTTEPQIEIYPLHDVYSPGL